jgi:large subunit GTPase 1
MSRGHVGHGGLPNETRAARQILKDYIDGKIPHYELPPGDEMELRETTSAADESASYDSNEQDDAAGPDMRHVLSDLESFDLATEGSKAAEKKQQQEASHKQHRKPQRKKDRSWRVGDDGGDGTAVVRAFQKPTVNTPAVGVSRDV